MADPQYILPQRTAKEPVKIEGDPGKWSDMPAHPTIPCVFGPFNRPPKALGAEKCDKCGARIELERTETGIKLVGAWRYGAAEGVLCFTCRPLVSAPEALPAPAPASDSPVMSEAEYLGDIS